ncbi:Obg-like ATPase [Xylographa carneopallida]|nr:Obg-like ATPase [Xylographa carneopallida]
MAARTVFVTGANRGVGFAILQSLAQCLPEDRFLLPCRTRANGEEAVRQLHELGVEAAIEVLKLDVTSDESIAQAEAWVEKKVGGLDVLINNAGTAVLPKPSNSNLRASWTTTLFTSLTSVGSSGVQQPHLKQNTQLSEGPGVTLTIDSQHDVPDPVSLQLIKSLFETVRSKYCNPNAHRRGRKMPPKKKEEEKKLLLGRPGNSLKSGIVGLANVGKSTLFQAITKCSLGNPANFPYATIEPEEARVIVPDARYDWLCDHYKPKSQVPANLTVYDIAGLTRGASTGAGLGNAFLSHIRAVDAIFQVVRCFDDAEIIHVEGDVDPIRDLDIISEELRIKDIEFVEKALENLKKQTRRGGQSLEMKKLKEEEATVEKILAWLKDGKDVRKESWSPKEVEIINPLFLLTAKPVVYLVNLSEKDYIRQKNKHLPKIAEWVKEHATGDPILPLSISFEERLTRFETEAEVEEECKKLGTKSALPKIIVTMRKALNLGSFFTTGTDEVRQWTIRNGTKAPQAAGVIHGDFEKTFIQCIVYNFEVLKEVGDEAGVKAAGKILTKGKDYVVMDGDILLIKAGAAKA